MCVQRSFSRARPQGVVSGPAVFWLRSRSCAGSACGQGKAMLGSSSHLQVRISGCKFQTAGSSESCHHVCFPRKSAIAQKLHRVSKVVLTVSKKKQQESCHALQQIAVAPATTNTGSRTPSIIPRTTALTMAARFIHNVAVQRKLRRRLSRRRSTRGRSRSRAATIPVNVSKLQFPRSLLAARVAGLVQARGLGLRVGFERALGVVSMLDRPGAERSRLCRRSSRRGQKGWRRRVAGVPRVTPLVATGVGLLLGRLCRLRGSRVLRLTAAVVPGREAFVEFAFADETDTVVARGSNVMEGGCFTILLIICQVVVQDQILDTLLLLAFGLLLCAHCHGESRV
jgi:hypothetical protein